MSENEDPFFNPERDIVREDLENWFVIETDDILKSYSHEDIKTFVYDFFLSFNILRRLDYIYGKGKGRRLDNDIKKFRIFINDWNRKYRDIILEFIVDGIQCRLDIYLITTVSEVSKLIERMNRFVNLQKSASKVAATFETGSGDNSLTLKSEKKMMKVIYLEEDMLNPKSPEFKLCTYFAMKNGFEKEINLQKYAEEFSFDLGEGSGEGGWARRYPGIEFMSYKK